MDTKVAGDFVVETWERGYKSGWEAGFMDGWVKARQLLDMDALKKEMAKVREEEGNL